LIGPEGVNVGEPPVEAWCDMTNEGATEALIINSVLDGTYVGNFGAGYTSTELLAGDPAAASAADATANQSWLDLNLFDYSELRLAGYANESMTYVSEWIPRTELRIAFGEDGYLLYDSTGGYYWCGGDAEYTDDGVGQVSQPDGAPADCKGHSSLGSGWDFSDAVNFNQGLTLCGGDASIWMYSTYGSDPVFYSDPGAAQVIWVR
jgi:hypothetical protein